MAKKKKYAPQPAGYLYNVPKPPMLIDSILPTGGLVGVSAKPGVGKSWFAMEMCRALATGTKFLNKFAVEQTSVLFVGSDSSEFDYATCWKRLTQGQYETLGGRDADVGADGGDEGDYNVLSDRVRFLVESDFAFDDDEKVDALAEAVNYTWGRSYMTEEAEIVAEDGHVTIVPPQEDWHSGAGVVVFDTFGSVTAADLSDNTAMLEVYKRVRRFITQTGATVVLLHHNPHGRASWLGAISQVGKLDVWMQLGHIRNTPDDVVGIRFEKFRGIKPGMILYRMNVNDPDEASLDWYEKSGKNASEEVPPGEVATTKDPGWEQVLDCLKSGPQTTTAIWQYKQNSFNRAASDDAAKKDVQRLLPEMEEKGAIRCVEKAKGNMPATWALPKANGASATVLAPSKGTDLRS